MAAIHAVDDGARAQAGIPLRGRSRLRAVGTGSVPGVDASPSAAGGAVVEVWGGRAFAVAVVGAYDGPSEDLRPEAGRSRRVIGGRVDGAGAFLGHDCYVVEGGSGPIRLSDGLRSGL